MEQGLRDRAGELHAINLHLVLPAAVFESGKAGGGDLFGRGHHVRPRGGGFFAFPATRSETCHGQDSEKAGGEEVHGVLRSHSKAGIT
jgi:hypothetical protein